jgi:hypothetical protein
VHRRRSYAVALNFALPGIMSLLALVNPHDSAFWRTSFAIVALGGAIVLATVRGYPVREAAAGLPGSAGAGAPAHPDQLALAAYIAGILLYIFIGVLAFVGGLDALRTEAILLTLMLFLGFNAAWLLLFDDRSPSHGRPPATAL